MYQDQRIKCIFATDRAPMSNDEEADCCLIGEYRRPIGG
jgi:hypothetical protein